jgi:hypothetical protein
MALLLTQRMSLPSNFPSLHRGEFEIVKGTPNSNRLMHIFLFSLLFRPLLPLLCAP